MKRLKFLITVCCFVICFYITASAEPYINFIYDAYGEAQFEPQAYVPAAVIDGKTMGTSELDAPMDVFAAKDGRIFL